MTGIKDGRRGIAIMNFGPQFDPKFKLALFILVCAGQTLGAARARAAAQADRETSSVSASGLLAKSKAAEHEYEAQVKAHPQSARAWSNLGAVRAMAGDCAAALPALHRARTLAPGLFVPWYFSGYCHAALHQDRMALEELERATRLNPKDPNAWYLEAETASRMNRLPVSLEAALRSMQFESKRAQSYYLAGQVALGIAKQEYKYVVDHQPSPFALRLRAERNAGQGVWMAAVADYRKAQELSPEAPDISFGLGSAYLQKGDYAEAEKEFRQCLVKVPDSAWAKLRLTLALAAQSKNDQAEQTLKDIQPTQLASPGEWQDLIAAEDMVGKAESARHRLAQAEALYPNFPEWQEWGQRLSSQGDVATAMTSFSFEHQGMIALSVSFLLAERPRSDDFLRQVFPDSARLELLRKAFLSGNPSAATSHVMALIRQKPSNSLNAFVAGEILQRAGLDFFEHLEIEYPDSEPAMVLEAENYSASGDQAKAIEIYKDLIRTKGPSTDNLRGLAQVYWKQNQWAKARPVLEQLAQLDPGDPTIFVNLGRICIYQDNVNDAEKYFRMAVRIQPNLYDALVGLGESLQRMGDLKDAAAELRLAARAEPQNPRPHYFLSQIYRMSGQRELAAQELANFQRLQARTGPGGAGQNGAPVPLD